MSQPARPTVRAFVVLTFVVSLGALAGCGGASPLGAKLLSIAVTPTAPTIAEGAHQQFTATGTFSDATTKDLSSTVTWASATTATATISATGLGTGLAAGTTVITATNGTIEGQATLTVVGGPAPKLVSIAVTPPSPSIGLGATQRFTATGTFEDGSARDVTATVTWASSTAATATIAATGEATAVAPGTTVITATSGTVSGSTTLNVITGRKLVSIAVTPVSTMIDRGTKQQFTAIGTFSDSALEDLTPTVTWASATPSIAAISAAGEATGVSAGSTVISATSGAISGSATLMVIMVHPVSIVVTPQLPTIAKGTKQQFIATVTFTDGTARDLTSQMTWTSATPAMATITSTGEATALAGGSTVISASFGALAGNTTLTVTGATLLSLAVTPATPAIANHTKVQFTAWGFFDDATMKDLTAKVTWASATPTNATISNAAGSNGEATAVAPGWTDISATLGTVSGGTTLTVTSPPLLSVAVTPASPSIAKGGKLQLTATATFGDNTTQDVTSNATWASATPATATISNVSGSSGQATALAEGTTVISATIVGGIKGMVTLTVTP